MDMHQKIAAIYFKSRFGFKFNFVSSMDMNLSIFKFTLITNTYKDYAYSKSRWSQFVFIHMKAYKILKL